MTVFTQSFDLIASASPAPAYNVGYNLRTFGPNVTLNISWLKENWNVDPNAINAVQNANGSVTISGGGDTWNGQLTTVAQQSGSPGWSGIAFGGGAYFQANLFWTGSYNGSAGFPAWWGDGFEAIIDPYNTSGGRNRWIETDFMEYWSATNWTGWIHNWVGGSSVNDQNSGGINLASGVQASDPHAYGALWVPATATSQGYIKYFFDGSPVGTPVTWNLNQTPYGDYLDTHHVALFLGTSTSNPMTVNAVEVWQASNANNVVA